MALYQMSPAHGAGARLARPVELICFALVVAHATYLLTAYLQGVWLVAPDGSGVPSDFVNVWAAGRMVLAGHAASVYDWPAHKLVEVSAIGHPFDGYFGWHYPPTFLFVAAALSLLPYAIAYVFWVFATFPAYLAAIRAIIGGRIGYLLAAAFPAVLSNFIVGQNGFLTAGLIGGALVLLEASTDLGRRVARTTDLQAASRFAVSDRADRGRLLADIFHRRDGCRVDGRCGVARLRRRGLAGVRRQYRPHLAGVPVPGLRRLEQAANRFRARPARSAAARRWRGACKPRWR